MKKIIYATLSVFLLAGAFVFKTVQHYSDILRELQMDTADAKESIFFNFQDGVLDFPYSTVVINLPSAKEQQQ